MAPHLVSAIKKSIISPYIDPSKAPKVDIELVDTFTSNREAVGPNKTRKEKIVIFTVTIIDEDEDTESTVLKEAKSIEKDVKKTWNVQINKLSFAAQRQWKQLKLDVRTRSGRFPEMTMINHVMR